MKVTLVRVTEDPKMAMAEAGSNCYDSDANLGIVDHCYKSGHHSIMEFAVFHFHIEGVSRALTHQLVRHRVASYAQRSQRYVVEDNFDYVKPYNLMGKGVTVNIHGQEYMLNFDDFMDIIKQGYNDYVEQGCPAEDARYLLPNSCASTIDVQMNLRSLMHFCNERLCQRAQWEIRWLAKEMKRAVVDRYISLAKYLVPKCEIHNPFSFCTEDNSCKKYPQLSSVFDNHWRYLLNVQS